MTSNKVWVLRHLWDSSMTGTGPAFVATKVKVWEALLAVRLQTTGLGTLHGLYPVSLATLFSAGAELRSEILRVLDP